VLLDGRPIKLDAGRRPHGYLAYYKPAGEVTTREDPERRATVFERLPSPPRGRWISIGRLDFNTSGLLLLTTDGELAHRLMHPRYEIPREYAVRLLGEPSADQLERLTHGVELDDGLARFDRIEPRGGSGRNAWLHVTLREGRNREVRRLFEALGLTVSRLIRVRYGPIELGRLQRGDTRALQKQEIVRLYEAVGLRLTEPEPRHAGPSRPSSRGRAGRDKRG
jgi:23S rRNA pseudouridine2605 synthase